MCRGKAKASLAPRSGFGRACYGTVRWCGDPTAVLFDPGPGGANLKRAGVRSFYQLRSAPGRLTLASDRCAGLKNVGAPRNNGGLPS